MTSARATVDEAMTEKAWQTQVLKLAKQTGWLAYHTFDSRYSPKGFPDLVVVRGPQLIFLELKTETGVVSDDQEDWMASLKRVRQVHADIARPHNWDDIERTLTARAR